MVMVLQINVYDTGATFDEIDARPATIETLEKVSLNGKPAGTTKLGTI